MRKKILPLILISFIGFHSFGQNNEVKFNIVSAIAGYPELTYEKIIDDNISIGASAAVSVEKAEDMLSRYSLTPYSRLYFGKKKSNGFFVEANMTLKGQRDLYYYGILDSSYNVVGTAKNDKRSTSFGFGAAIGVKLLTKKSAFAEIFAGGGRLFGSPIIDGYFRGGITIGFRF